MAQLGDVRCTVLALVLSCMAHCLGGGACAASVRISLSGIRSRNIAPQFEAGVRNDPSLVEAVRPAPGDNLGLSAAEALTRVWEQLAGTGQQATDSRIDEQQDFDKLSTLDGADYEASAVDVVEPTLELYAESAAPQSAAEELNEASAAPQPTDAPTGMSIAGDGAAAQLWPRAQRMLSWLMGCTHATMLMHAQPQLLSPAQLQVTGSSEALPAAAEGPMDLLRQLSVARPLKVTMLLSSILPCESAGLLQPQGYIAVPDQAQQEPLMMQKDGMVRPQKLANLLQSLSRMQAASRTMPAEATSQMPGSMQPQQSAETMQQLPGNAFDDYLRSQPADSRPQVATPQKQDFGQPQSTATNSQQLPWILFGEQLRGETSLLPPQPDLADAEEAEDASPNARAAIPGQDVMEQVQAAEEPVMALDTQLASSGDVDGSFPSPVGVAQAGAELAQKLGLSLEEALDRVVSTVLQQRGGGSPEWAREIQGGEEHSILTELDTLPAAENDQQADDEVWREVTAVPPEAGPVVREGYLQRAAGFCDQLLGRVARALGAKTEQTEVAEDARGPVVLATATGRGPTEVRPYNTERGRVVEGVSADGYFVEPDLIADDVPLEAAGPEQAPAPDSANLHNNAAAAPEPDEEPAQLAALTAPGPAATAPAAANPSGRGNANAHNNSA